MPSIAEWVQSIRDEQNQRVQQQYDKLIPYLEAELENETRRKADEQTLELINRQQEYLGEATIDMPAARKMTDGIISNLPKHIDIMNKENRMARRAEEFGVLTTDSQGNFLPAEMIIRHTKEAETERGVLKKLQQDIEMNDRFTLDILKKEYPKEYAERIGDNYKFIEDGKYDVRDIVGWIRKRAAEVDARDKATEDARKDAEKTKGGIVNTEKDKEQYATIIKYLGDDVAENIIKAVKIGEATLEELGTTTMAAAKTIQDNEAKIVPYNKMFEEGGTYIVDGNKIFKITGDEIEIPRKKQYETDKAYKKRLKQEMKKRKIAREGVREGYRQLSGNERVKITDAHEVYQKLIKERDEAQTILDELKNKYKKAVVKETKSILDIDEEF